MRALATLLSWLIATAMLAVVLPAEWVQRNLVNTDGYALLAQRAAAEPALQGAVADELANQLTGLLRDAGRGRDADPAVLRDAAAGYTAGPGFPPQFAEANRALHRWAFDGGTGPWLVDVAPMLDDPAFRSVLADHGLRPPATATVALTVPGVTAPPGRLRALAAWTPWVSVTAGLLAGVGAAATLVGARRRGRAITGLGVSALLVGAVGWAAVESGRRRLAGGLNAVLDEPDGDVRRVADAMIGTGVDGLHHWLNLTLAAGAVLVGCGVVVAMLGSLRRW